MFPSELPELLTPRLRLRALAHSDAPAIFQYLSLDAVAKFQTQAAFACVQEAEHLIQTWQNHFVAQHGLHWGITLIDDNTVIGTCGLQHFCLENSRAQIHFDLHPKHWQQGLMSEAVQALLQYGFSVLDLHRLEAFINPLNEAAATLLGKVGLQAEGVLRDYFFGRGHFVNAQVWASLNPNDQDEISRLMSALGDGMSDNPLEHIRQMRAQQLHVCAIENRGQWLKAHGEILDMPES